MGNNKEKKKRIIIFGAGKLLEKTLKCLDYRCVKIIAIADNDEKKHFTKYKNITIIPATRINRVKFDYVVIANANYINEIQKQLREMGIKNVLPLYAENKTEIELKIQNILLNPFGKLYIKYREVNSRQAFYPDWRGIWFNPCYHARKGLVESIKKYSKHISGKCLDFGCGSMPYRKLFNVDEYIGVEIDCDNKKDGIVYYDGHTLPFEDEYFDSIITSQVFEHVINLDEMLIELKRVLKKDGYMLITVPFVFSEHHVPYDFRRFTSYGIKNYLETNGLRIVNFEKSGDFIKTIFQMKNVYLTESVRNELLMKILCCGNNFLGSVLSSIICKNDSLYLDNVILVKK